MCRTYAFTFCARFSKLLGVVSSHDPAVDLQQYFNEIKIILNIAWNFYESKQSLTSIKSPWKHRHWLMSLSAFLDKLDVKRKKKLSDQRFRSMFLSIRIPYVDGLINQLLECPHTELEIQIRHIIPSFVSNASYSDISEVVEYYREGLPDALSNKVESDRWQIKWGSEGKDNKRTNAIKPCLSVVRIEQHTFQTFVPSSTSLLYYQSSMYWLTFLYDARSAFRHKCAVNCLLKWKQV